MSEAQQPERYGARPQTMIGPAGLPGMLALHCFLQSRPFCLQSSKAGTAKQSAACECSSVLRQQRVHSASRVNHSAA